MANYFDLQKATKSYLSGSRMSRQRSIMKCQSGIILSWDLAESVVLVQMQCSHGCKSQCHGFRNPPVGWQSSSTKVKRILSITYFVWHHCEAFTSFRCSRLYLSNDYSAHILKTTAFVKIGTSKLKKFTKIT